MCRLGTLLRKVPNPLSNILSWVHRVSVWCRVDSIDGLKAKLAEFREMLKDKAFFKEVYNFTFGFAKDQGQKSLGTAYILSACCVHVRLSAPVRGCVVCVLFLSVSECASAWVRCLRLVSERV